MGINIDIDNINEEQMKQLNKLFDDWLKATDSGMNRWVSFYVHSDEQNRPKIKINGEEIVKNDFSV